MKTIRRSYLFPDLRGREVGHLIRIHIGAPWRMNWRMNWWGTGPYRIPIGWTVKGWRRALKRHGVHSGRLCPVVARRTPAGSRS